MFGCIAGSILQLLIAPETPVPVLGFVLGGLFFFGVNETFRNE